MLELQKKQVKKLRNNNVIWEIDYKKLMKDIDRKINKLENKNFAWSTSAEVNFFEMEYPIFNCLTPEEKRKLLENLSETRFKGGENLFTKDQDIQHMMLITQGTVEEALNEQCQVRKGMGNMIGFIHAVINDYTTNSSVLS